MDSVIEIIKTLNTLSPLGVIALLALVLFYQAKNNKAAVDSSKTLHTVRTNDLHELPEIAETLRRIEVTQSQAFATIIARLGRGKDY